MTLGARGGGGGRGPRRRSPQTWRGEGEFAPSVRSGYGHSSGQAGTGIQSVKSIGAERGLLPLIIFTHERLSNNGLQPHVGAGMLLRRLASAGHEAWERHTHTRAEGQRRGQRGEREERRHSEHISQSNTSLTPALSLPACLPACLPAEVPGAGPGEAWGGSGGGAGEAAGTPGGKGGGGEWGRGAGGGAGEPRRRSQPPFSSALWGTRDPLLPSSPSRGYFCF